MIIIQFITLTLSGGILNKKNGIFHIALQCTHGRFISLRATANINRSNVAKCRRLRCQKMVPFLKEITLSSFVYF